MELLARTLRTFRHFVGNQRSAFALSVGVFLLVAIEVGGPYALSTDWQDLIVAAGLAVVLVYLGHQHTRSPLPWLQPLTQLGRAVGGRLKRWFFDIGYDLRGEPRVKRGVPPLVLALAGLFFAWGAVLLAFGDYFPGVLRDAGVRFFYLGYLSVMA